MSNILKVQLTFAEKPKTQTTIICPNCKEYFNINDDINTTNCPNCGMLIIINNEEE